MSATAGPQLHVSSHSDSITRALAVFVAAAAIVLVGALFTGATTLFNVTVSALFIVLWVAFAAAVILSPVALEESWQKLRQRSLLVQAVAWVLFLPIVAGLCVWQRHWSRLVRLPIIASIAFVNLVMFLGH